MPADPFGVRSRYLVIAFYRFKGRAFLHERHMNSAFRSRSAALCQSVITVKPRGLPGPGPKRRLTMKTTLATVTLAALLSVGAAAASAMPVAAPAAETAANAPVELVGHRGHRSRAGRHHILPRQAVIRSLHHRGFRNISNVRFVRGDYV